MNIGNLGFQLVGMMRKEMTPEIERAIKNCNSFKQLHRAGKNFKYRHYKAVRIKREEI